MSGQLALLHPNVSEAHWAKEGCGCAHCPDGRVFLRRASAACTCDDPVCGCTAEGYAVCDGCGVPVQVWPREMVAPWTEAAVALAPLTLVPLPG